VEFTVNISDDRTATFIVTIPAEEVQEKLDGKIKELHRTMVIPGFRPGKAPLSLFRTRYGKAVYSDIVEEESRKALQEIIKQYETQLVGDLELMNMETVQGQPIKLTVVAPLKAEPALSLYKGLKVSIPTAIVNDTEIDKYINLSRKRKKVMQSVDTPATTDAKLTLEVQEVDPSGLPLIGKTVETQEITFGTDALGAGASDGA
jgi:trigger factor